MLYRKQRTRNTGANTYAVGVGMIPRGEVGLTFASIGLAQGILNAEVYAELILVVFFTTLIAPWWLKKTLAGHAVLSTRAKA